MNQEYRIVVNQDGIVQSSDFLPMIEMGESIGDSLPIYSYLESFRNTDPFLIEGYDFNLDKRHFIIDTEISFENSLFEIKIIDRTTFYQNRIINQTTHNKVKIEKEYQALGLDLYKTEANHLIKVSNTLKSAVKQSITDIKNDFKNLSFSASEKLHDDPSLSEFINRLYDKLDVLNDKLVSTSTINKINPIDLFERPRHIALKKEIDHVIENDDFSHVKIKNSISEEISIFCNEEYSKNVVSHFLNAEKINGFQDVEIQSVVSEKGIVEVLFNYRDDQTTEQNYAERKQLLLPGNEEVFKNGELMSAIIQNVSNIYIQELNACLAMA